MHRTIDRLLPILPAMNRPLIILCRGGWASFSGYRKRNGFWFDSKDRPIHKTIVGWEYHDGKARGRYRGSKIVGLYLLLHSHQARVKQVMIVK